MYIFDQLFPTFDVISIEKLALYQLSIDLVITKALSIYAKSAFVHKCSLQSLSDRLAMQQVCYLSF